MLQNLCLSLLALVTYTIELFWNLQDFEKGRVRIDQTPATCCAQMFHMSKLSFSCVYADVSCVSGSSCSSTLVMTGVPISATSCRIWVPCAWALPQSYLFLLFCILNMCLLIHKNPCDAWFDCCSLVCLSALTLQLRQLLSGASASGAGFTVTYVQFLNIYQGIYICEHVSLTLFDQTCNVS